MFYFLRVFKGNTDGGRERGGNWLQETAAL